ncbi:ArnT family glycosyltransferase, partial [Verrucomicrobiota bacterium]
MKTAWRHLIARPGATVFAVALAVRLLYLFESARNPTFTSPIVDAATYDTAARHLAETGRFTKTFFWQPFFYPAFLAAVYAVSGSSVLFAKIVQCVLGAMTCVLTWRLGRRVVGHAAGLTAGLIAGLYGPMVFYDGELLATGWASFWSAATLLLLLTASEGRTGTCFCFGICGGLSILTRPTFAPFVLAGSLWLVWKLATRSSSGRSSAAPMLAAAAGLLLALLPVAHLSHEVTGRFSVLPSSGGINLYIGNNPEMSGTLCVRPGWHWDDLTRMPARHGVPPGPPAAKFFAEEAMTFALANPGTFLLGMGVKTLHLISSRELPRNV